MAEILCPVCWCDPKKLLTCVTCGKDGYIADDRFTENFWYSEFVESPAAIRAGIPNMPNAEEIIRIAALCRELMEVIRAKFGAIQVTSGFRSEKVNSLIGGSSTSAHRHGYAVDFKSWDGVSLKTMMNWIIASPLKYDQVIYEGTWIHLGHYRVVTGKAPEQRRQALMAFPVNGAMVYEPYNPNDKRVR